MNPHIINFIVDLQEGSVLHSESPMIFSQFIIQC